MRGFALYRHDDHEPPVENVSLDGLFPGPVHGSETWPPRPDGRTLTRQVIAADLLCS